MHRPLVTINLVVWNGERYVRHCLNAVKKQTYPHIEVNVFDNASTDATREIVAREFPEFNLIAHPKNLGMWPGQEEALKRSNGEYVLCLSVDVILDPRFVQEAVAALERHREAGAIQGKLYQYELAELERGMPLNRDVIDTCGFCMNRSRKVINIGHGEKEQGQHDAEREVFGVEGAVPVFRRSALEDCRINGEIADKNYFWYGDDLDLAWRMQLFGHAQFFVPSAVAWHDRSTTKGFATVPVIGQLRRLGSRSAIPLGKRRLDWANVRCTIAKNDYILNVLRDLPWIVARECAVLGYLALFEPKVLGAFGRFIRLLPRMFAQRRLVMKRARRTSDEMHRWFISS